MTTRTLKHQHILIFDTLLMHKAIMAHEHINKYNTIHDSEIHKTQHSCNTMPAFQTKALGDIGVLVYRERCSFSSEIFFCIR